MDSIRMENYTVVMEYTTSYLIEICLYFFVFEMQSVQQVLKSQDPKQNEAGQRKAAIG
jgi:hypothetical protein